MDTTIPRIPRRRRPRLFSVGAAIALVAMLLPATAGIALGHTASAGCDQIRNDPDPKWGQFSAVVYVHDATTGTAILPANAIVDGHTTVVGSVAIGPGHYDVKWSDNATNSNLHVTACDTTTTTAQLQTTATAGDTIGDTAQVTQVSGPSVTSFIPTGTVTFSLYGPFGSAPVCDPAHLVTTTSSVTLDSSGKVTSPAVTAPSTLGTYQWVATYGGDANNNSSVSGCGDEPVTVTSAPRTAAITLYKFICPTYDAIPANKNPGNLDATGGKKLDTSIQTRMVNTATDVPGGCTAAPGWQFKLTAGSEGPVIGNPTTGSDGSVLVTLTGANADLVKKGTWETGVVVSEVFQAGYGFGALRCYKDINNGDNLEGIFGWNGTDAIACIAYNVAKAAPTGSLTVTKVVSGAPAGWTAGTFTFAVTCTSPAFTKTDVTITTAATGTSTIAGIPLGEDLENSCTVQETGKAEAPAGYTTWSTSYSPEGGATQVTKEVAGAVTVRNATSLIPPAKGYFQFTKTVSGNLTGWTGGQFPFTVTCTGGNPVPVTLTLDATGAAVTSQSFGPFDPETSCSVIEGNLPAAGTNAGWVNSPSYVPISGSASIVSGQTVTVAVTNTRTYSPPPPTIRTPTRRPRPRPRRRPRPRPRPRHTHRNSCRPADR
jgi:hypothetical protein